MRLSVVIPIYNEALSLPKLLDELAKACADVSGEYEMLAVDDASSDESFAVLKAYAKKDTRLKIIRFRANAGQTAAIAAGVARARGDIVVTIDSDLENDPKDIPRLLSKLNEGYDVVSGWRTSRWQGQTFTRRMPSLIANALISFATGVRLHDYGCTLKAYRKECLADVRLYGEMHRFIPAYASWHGARVTEVSVAHRPRQFGRSNYGLSRTFRVLLDLLLVVFLDRFMTRPIHFFGGFGFLSLALGLLAGGLSIILKLIDYKDFVETPLPVFSALLVIVGVQLIALGVVAEMIMRVYYEAQDKTPYAVRETVNL